MILATHAIAGAAVGRLAGNPILAFIFGLASHFILDAIPHWQYELKSRTRSDDIMKEDMSLNRKLIGDVVRLGIDFFSGTFISVLAFSGWGGFTNPPAPLVAGVIGGVLPDALQFLFWKFRREPLISIQKFHSFMHADWEFGYKSKFGVVLQVVLAAIIIFISRTIIR
jgi:hypothetical protein